MNTWITAAIVSMTASWWPLLLGKWRTIRRGSRWTLCFTAAGAATGLVALGVTHRFDNSGLSAGLAISLLLLAVSFLLRISNSFRPEPLVSCRFESGQLRTIDGRTLPGFEAHLPAEELSIIQGKDRYPFICREPRNIFDKLVFVDQPVLTYLDGQPGHRPWPLADLGGSVICLIGSGFCLASALPVDTLRIMPVTLIGAVAAGMGLVWLAWRREPRSNVRIEDQTDSAIHFVQNLSGN